MRGMVRKQRNCVVKKKQRVVEYSRENTGFVCYYNVMMMSPVTAFVNAFIVELDTTTWGIAFHDILYGMGEYGYFFK